MNIESVTRVTVISGLAHVGKSTVARLLGTDPVALSPEADAAGLVRDAIQRRPPGGVVVVEAHPGLSPLDVAAGLLAIDGADLVAPGAPTPQLGDLVTVLDASRFWRDLRREGPAHPGADSDDDRTLGDLLVEQIEWATVVVINKTDLVSAAACDDIRDFVRLLNPASHVLCTHRGHDSAGAPWPAPRGDVLTWLQRSPGWVAQLNGETLLWRSTFGLTCVVYREPRPFHPERLADFLANRAGDAGEILRSRGLFRLATRVGIIGSWSSAGPTVTFEPTDMSTADAESPWGQEIAFFGRNLDPDRLVALLDACLLSDDELLAGPSAWARLADPFPFWDVDA